MHHSWPEQNDWAFIFGPVVAYKNKWPMDWASFWFYHKVPCNTKGGEHPLVVRVVDNLPTTHPGVDVKVEEADVMKAFVSMVRDVSKTYGTRDLIEEFVSCNCWPLRVG